MQDLDGSISLLTVKYTEIVTTVSMAINILDVGLAFTLRYFVDCGQTTDDCNTVRYLLKDQLTTLKQGAQRNSSKSISASLLCPCSASNL